jgi:hypothetical protein
MTKQLRVPAAEGVELNLRRHWADQLTVGPVSPRDPSA